MWYLNTLLLSHMDHECGSGLAGSSVHGLLRLQSEFWLGLRSHLKFGILLRAHRIHFIVIVLRGAWFKASRRRPRPPPPFFDDSS